MRLKDEDKQKRIKEAMVSLFLQEGMDGTSVSKIAKRAGVSPATIYVYYNSKEDMVFEVFREYSLQSYQYLLKQIRSDMDAASFIETLIRSSYGYFIENRDIFSFIEQCSRCPSITSQMCERDSCCDVMDLFHHYQREGQLQPYSDWNMQALLFAPVRFLAMNHSVIEQDEETLNELIHALQSLLIR